MRSRDVAVSQNHFIFLLGPTVWACEAFVRGVKTHYKQPLVSCSPELSVSATGADKSLIAMTTAAHTDTHTRLSLSVCLTIFKGQITAAQSSFQTANTH